MAHCYSSFPDNHVTLSKHRLTTLCLCVGQCIYNSCIGFSNQQNQSWHQGLLKLKKTKKKTYKVTAIVFSFVFLWPLFWKHCFCKPYIDKINTETQIKLPQQQFYELLLLFSSVLKGLNFSFSFASLLNQYSNKMHSPPHIQRVVCLWLKQGV